MSAVKMELYVYNQYERMVLDQALTIIEAARHEQMEALKGNVPPGQMQDAPPAPAGDTHAEESVEGKVIGSIPRAEPVPPAAPAQDVPSEADMAAAVQKALDVLGLAKVREIVAPITGGKRWRETDPARWLEITLALSVGMAKVAK
jgi:hypothetical protein